MLYRLKLVSGILSILKQHLLMVFLWFYGFYFRMIRVRKEFPFNCPNRKFHGYFRQHGSIRLGHATTLPKRPEKIKKQKKSMV